MDILIKNIELKGSLLLTPKAIFKPVEEYDNEKIVQKWEIVKDAEIVPVPEHGRLIDADELVGNISDTYCEKCPRTKPIMCRACEYEDIMDDIENAPTVIPSSDSAVVLEANK